MRTLRRFVAARGAVPGWLVLAFEAILVIAVANVSAALVDALLSGPDYIAGPVVPLLQMVTAALAAGVWLMCTGTARLHENRRALRTIAAAWAFYGLCVMPLYVLHTTTPNLAVGAGAFTAALAFLVLLTLGLAGLRDGWGPGAWGFAVASAATVVVIAAVALLPFPALAHMPSLGSGAMIGLGWLLLACWYTVRGWHDRNPFVWRLGFGLGVVAAAHLARFLFGATDAQFVVLRTSGLLVIAVGVGACLSSVSRRMRAEQALEAERAATAAHAHERRDHEMRNALTNLAALPQIMSDDGEDTPNDRARIAGLLSAELSRLGDLLAESPSEPGSHTAPVDLVLTRLATLRRAVGKTITVDCERGLLAAIPTATLTQVVTNLLVNCDRHAPGSPVHVTAERTEQRCVIQVIDAGPGASEQGDTQAEGYGIGLALTSQLVAQHDGDFALLAAPPGKTGCTARVQLRLPHPGYTAPAWRDRMAS